MCLSLSPFSRLEGWVPVASPWEPPHMACSPWLWWACEGELRACWSLVSGFCAVPRLPRGGNETLLIDFLNLMIEY